jgi:5-hydroxyisourate hydrolase-like protein (transthyretin family)
MRIVPILFFAWTSIWTCTFPAAFAAELHGTVTAENGGDPLAGIEVSLYRPAGTGWTLQSFTSTESSGTYSFDGPR